METIFDHQMTPAELDEFFFGDPETEAVLTLLDGNFAELLHSAAIGKINHEAIQIKKDLHACCVVLASNGYPGSFEKGFEISGIYSYCEAKNSRNKRWKL